MVTNNKEHGEEEASRISFQLLVQRQTDQVTVYEYGISIRIGHTGIGAFRMSSKSIGILFPWYVNYRNVGE